MRAKPIRHRDAPPATVTVLLLALAAPLATTACAEIASADAWPGAASSAGQGPGSSSSAGGGGFGGIGGSGGTAAAGGGGFAGYPQVVLDDGPVAYWRLGEATLADPAADSSGHGHDGVYLRPVALGASGAVAGDTAAQFDGRDGQISFYDIFEFAGREHFSLEAWVSPNPLNTTYRHIVDNRFDDGSGKQGYVLFVLHDRVAFERYLDGLTDTAEHIKSPPIPTDAFTHLVATYDGDVMTLYLNAMLLGAASSTKGLTTSSNDLLVVGANGVGSNVFDGTIDEVAVYDSALTAGRILAHYDAR